MQIRRLNSLRALAALIVAVSHYSNMSGLWGAVMGKGAGQFGVMLFFILSGFLMAYLYLERAFRWPAVRGYLVARLARVWPLFAFVVLLSFVAQRIHPNRVAFAVDEWGRLASHLLLLKGTSILWTIPVEVQFYGTFLLLWLVTSFLKRGLILLCLLGIVAPGFLHYPEWSGRLWGGIEYDLFLATSLPYFSVGVMFGALYRRGTLGRLPQSSWFLIVLLVVPLMYPPIYQRVFGREHRMWEDPIVFLAMAGTLFTFLFLVPDGRLIANPVGDFLGKISYSIYLLHLPLVVAMEPLVQGGKVDVRWFFLVFLAATVALSSLSYFLIEAPARRRLRARWLRE